MGTDAVHLMGEIINAFADTPATACHIDAVLFAASDRQLDVLRSFSFRYPVGGYCYVFRAETNAELLTLLRQVRTLLRFPGSDEGIDYLSITRGVVGG